MLKGDLSMLFRLLVLVYYLMFVECFRLRNKTELDDIIVAPRSRSWSTDLHFIKGQYFYVKHMPMFRFELDTVSSTFVRIPGLIVAIEHDQPMLYKMHFSGGCFMTGFLESFIHFMINDKILIDNQLLPNTSDRDKYIPQIIGGLFHVDAHGGSFMRSSDTAGTFYTCTKYELVYLPPRQNIIEVVVRTNKPSLIIHTGTLIVEAVEYAKDANIRLKYPVEYH